MPQNVRKLRGQLKAGKPDAGGAGIFSTPMFGVVKDNIDPNRAGRIKVFITQLGAKDPNDSSNWMTVSYLSSFFGSVKPSSGQDSYGKFSTNPSSYGQWQSPPDIGSIVLCVFANGDPNYGFYIGGVPQAETLQMVPAIGALDVVVPNGGEANSYGGATRLPVTNMNTNDKNKTNSSNFINTPRPIHSYSASVMLRQGILRDPVRGPISSSASREPASRVGWGVSTPGRPIYEGGYTDDTLAKNLDPAKSQQLKVISRRGGHSIVMDDGDIIGRDQLIRIRTALGHQITMSDDGQTLMILHSNGQSYVELGKEGTVDIYSTNSFNVRTQGDINLHADRNINLNAQENLNIQANAIQINSEEDIKVRAGENINLHALADLTARAQGTASIAAGRESSLASAGATFINGAKVNLNTGVCSTLPKEVPKLEITAHCDTLWDEEKGFIAAPGKLLSIASRAPAHAPWANAGQGVDVKTNLNASEQLPQEANPTIQAINAEASTIEETTVAQATASSVPSTAPISKLMNSQITTSLMSASATQASKYFPKAVKLGAVIGSPVKVGTFGLLAEQMEQGGVIKPGSYRLVNTMTNATNDVARSLPSNIFTGKIGAEDLTSFARNVGAQTQTVANIAKKAQTGLTKMGAMSGKEAIGQVTGMINASVSKGIASAKGFITKLSTNPSSLIKNISPAGMLSAVSIGLSAVKLFGGGGVAKLQSTISKALALTRPQASLSTLTEQTLGSSAAAFYAIKESFPNLKPNEPQNLTQISKKTATDTATVASSTATDVTTAVAGASNTVKTSATSASDIMKIPVQSNKTNFTTLENSLNSVLGVTGQANLFLDTATSVESRFRPVENTIGTTGATSVKSLIEDTSGVSSMNQSIKQSVDEVSSMSGAAPIISSGQLNQLFDTASVVQKGATASTSAQIASGVSAIPGGAKTMGIIVNNASGAMDQNSTTINLTGNVDDIKTKYGDILKKSGGLSDIVKSGLPTGATAQLDASLVALSKDFPGSIKAPSVAYNTVDNSEITPKLDAVIDDPKVPKPNLTGEIKEETIKSLEQAVKSAKEFELTREEKRKLVKEKFEQAKLELEKAQSESVGGNDPKLRLAENKYIEAFDEYTYFDSPLNKRN